MDILRVFDGNAAKHPDKDYLRYRGDRLTYAQVRDESRRVVFAATLPRTPSGKVQKHLLKAETLDEREV